ncbi:MAG: hypothetical protein JEZ11_11400 [Desulfobacterales bacterium]|nr:hypothetical protein [Desulfobacterales bacterium]
MLIGGTLVYCDTVWQPLYVRLGDAAEVTGQTIEAACTDRNIRLVTVFESDLADARMQNMAILAAMAAGGIVPGVEPTHYREAMEDLMAGVMLEKNLALFDGVLAKMG